VCALYDLGVHSVQALGRPNIDFSFMSWAWTDKFTQNIVNMPILACILAYST